MTRLARILRFAGLLLKHPGLPPAADWVEDTSRWEHGDPTVPEDPDGPWGADVWPSYDHWCDEVPGWDFTPLATLNAPANADALVAFVKLTLCDRKEA